MLYHVTSQANLNSINEYGLVPNDFEDVVHLTLYPWSVGAAAMCNDIEFDDLVVFEVDIASLVTLDDLQRGALVEDRNFRVETRNAVVRDRDRHGQPVADLAPLPFVPEQPQESTWLLPGQDGFYTFTCERVIPPSALRCYEWTDADRVKARALYDE